MLHMSTTVALACLQRDTEEGVPEECNYNFYARWLFLLLQLKYNERMHYI